MSEVHELFEKVSLGCADWLQQSKKSVQRSYVPILVPMKLLPTAGRQTSQNLKAMNLCPIVDCRKKVGSCSNWRRRIQTCSCWASFCHGISVGKTMFLAWTLWWQCENGQPSFLTCRLPKCEIWRCCKLTQWIALSDQKISMLSFFVMLGFELLVLSEFCLPQLKFAEICSGCSCHECKLKGLIRWTAHCGSERQCCCKISM